MKNLILILLLAFTLEIKAEEPEKEYSNVAECGTILEQQPRQHCIDAVSTGAVYINDGTKPHPIQSPKAKDSTTVQKSISSLVAPLWVIALVLSVTLIIQIVILNK